MQNGSLVYKKYVSIGLLKVVSRRIFMLLGHCFVQSAIANSFCNSLFFHL